MVLEIVSLTAKEMKKTIGCIALNGNNRTKKGE